MRIEPAEPDDIPALSDLLAILFAQEAEFMPDPAAQREGLARIIGDSRAGVVLVAREGDAAIGMVSLLFTVSTARGGRVALLEDMVVAPERRGAGVGTRLLAEAIAVARARHCARITLLADHVNDAAQRFYERQGFVRSSMVPMRLSFAEK